MGDWHFDTDPIIRKRPKEKPMDELRALTELKRHLGTKRTRTDKEDRLYGGLRAERRPWRKRIANNLIEDRICEVQGVRDPTKIDWENIDWAAVLSIVLKLLLMFLAI